MKTVVSDFLKVQMEILANIEEDFNSKKLDLYNLNLEFFDFETILLENRNKIPNINAWNNQQSISKQTNPKFNLTKVEKEQVEKDSYILFEKIVLVENDKCRNSKNIMLERYQELKRRLSVMFLDSMVLLQGKVTDKLDAKRIMR